MDPVSVFNSLFDTQCIKFGLKSGYVVDLRRLPFYPKLFDAIVTQLVERFLIDQTVLVIDTQSRQQRKIVKSCSISSKAYENGIVSPSTDESDADSQIEEELDSDISGESEDINWGKVTNKLEPIICGVQNGAIPQLVTVVTEKLQAYLLERLEAESDGSCQSGLSVVGSRSIETTAIENKSKKEQQQKRVILIEDVIGSGESTLETVRTIQRQNLKVDSIICIIDCEQNGVNLILEQTGVRVHPLYSMGAILRVLEATGRLTTEQFARTKQCMNKNHVRTVGGSNGVVCPAKAKCSPMEMDLSRPHLLPPNECV